MASDSQERNPATPCLIQHRLCAYRAGAHSPQSDHVPGGGNLALLGSTAPRCCSSAAHDSHVEPTPRAPASSSGADRAFTRNPGWHRGRRIAASHHLHEKEVSPTSSSVSIYDASISCPGVPWLKAGVDPTNVGSLSWSGFVCFLPKGVHSNGMQTAKFTARSSRGCVRYWSPTCVSHQLTACPINLISTSTNPT